MSVPRELRCYEYVNRPFDQVRAVLHNHVTDLLQRATTTAAARASSLAANLRVAVGGIEIGVDIRTYVKGIRDSDSVAGVAPVTTVEIGWDAARTPALFPSMRAELSAWPLSSSETQIAIEGSYRPPLGAVGNAIDAAVGHRIAEAAVHRFLEDIVEQMRRDLPAAP